MMDLEVLRTMRKIDNRFYANISLNADFEKER